MFEIERGKLITADGTALGYLKLGSGKPLVLCHGSFSTAQDWLPFAHEMAATHSVYLYDRRGRGMSPASSDFALEAEVDDLAGILALAGPGAALLGHSYGGGCALRLAERDRFVGPLIVYEPRHSAHGQMSRGRIPELRALIAEGNDEAALEFAMTAIVGLPEPAVVAFRQAPQWAQMRALVSVLPNELRFLDSLTWQPGDLDAILLAPWLLVGGDTSAIDGEVSPEVALRRVLPAIRTIAIPGQKHFAHVAAPALTADIVRECLSPT